MKTVVLLTAFLCSSMLFSQKITYQEYQEEARNNKRLLPKYSQLPGMEAEIAEDQAYIEDFLSAYPNQNKVSAKILEEGAKVLKDDPRLAMMNFNRAYLLDSNNAGIYWGYGQIYDQFEQFETAQSYYQQGLQINPRNVMLLNAAAKNHLKQAERSGDPQHLNRSIELLQSSFREEPHQPKTSALLCTSYLKMGNCKQAEMYFKVHQSLERSIDDELAEVMNKKCPSAE